MKDKPDCTTQVQNSVESSDLLARVIITKCMVGIFHMQVCAVADATDEEILAVCNRENPSGTSMGWCQVVRSGEGAPVNCEQHSGRTHFLAAC